MDPAHNTLCHIINQIHGVEDRTRQLPDHDFYHRRFDRIRDLFRELQIHIHNPIGEAYDQTRTDCEAIMDGDPVPPLAIVEVIKPIIYQMSPNGTRILQQGIVIIKGKQG